MNYQFDIDGNHTQLNWSTSDREVSTSGGLAFSLVLTSHHLVGQVETPHKISQFEVPEQFDSFGSFAQIVRSQFDDSIGLVETLLIRRHPPQWSVLNGKRSEIFTRDPRRSCGQSNRRESHQGAPERSGLDFEVDIGRGAPEVTPVQPLERMLERIDVGKNASDSQFFLELMYFGEMMTKLIVIGLVSSMEDDRQRQRYGIEYELVRADGVGKWIEKLDSLTVGTASALLDPEIAAEKRELMQNFSPRSDSWQRTACDQMLKAITLFDRTNSQPDKLSMIWWFKQFAFLRNTTRGHGTPDASMCSELSEILDPAMQKIHDNYAGFAMPWAVLKQNQNGKYRVATLAGELSSLNYLKSDPSFTIPNGTYRVLGGKLRRVHLIDADVELKNVFLPNGNFRRSDYEGLSYLTNEKKTLDGSEFLEPPGSLPRSGTAAVPNLHVFGHSFTNCPDVGAGYISRSELETAVIDLLLDKRHPIVTLVGQGGVGKTSLALQVIHKIMEGEEFYSVIWFSGRDIDLDESGTKNVQPDVTTEAEIADLFTDFMNPMGSSDKNFDVKRFFRDSLSSSNLGEPILYVFDNFETMKEPVELYQVLDSSIQLPSKILITSRFREFRADYPVEIRGMSSIEFSELVDSEARRLNCLSRLNKELVTQLFDVSGGHPYIAKVMIAEFAGDPRVVSFQRVMAEKDEILAALFARSYQNLSAPTQRVFLTVASWRTLIPRLAINAAIARNTEENIDVERALDQLERGSLIEFVRGPSDVEDFVKVPLAASEFARKMLPTSGYRLVVEDDLKMLYLFGPSQGTEVSKGLGPRVNQLFSNLRTDVARGHSIDEGLKLLTYIALKFPEAWLRIADLWEERRESDNSMIEARSAVQKYLSERPNDRAGWSRLARLSRDSPQDFKGELNALLEAARLPGAGEYELSQLANRFNEMARRDNNFVVLDNDIKRSFAQAIRKLLEDPRHFDSADANYFSKLSWVCLNMNDQKSALDYTKKGLEIDPTNRFCLNLSARLSTTSEDNS
jgi:tetratricopeptide (TPR) repeat protein